MLNPIKKIAVVLIVLFSFSLLAKELLVANAEKLQIEKKDLDKYGADIKWYLAKYPDWQYCEGPENLECEDAEKCSKDFHCNSTIEDLNSIDAIKVKSLIDAIAFREMSFDRRARGIVESFYKDLYKNLANEKYSEIKEYAYSKEVLERLRFSEEVFLHIPQTLPYYKKLIIDGINTNPGLFKKLPENIRNDEEVALAAVDRYGAVLQYLSANLRDNKKIALAALPNITIDYANKYLSAKVLQDPEILRVISKKQDQIK